MRRTWKDIGARAKKIRSRGRIARFIGSEKDAKELEGLIAEINDSIQDKIVVRMVVDTFNLVGAHVLTDAGHTGRQGRLSKRFPGSCISRTLRSPWRK